MTGGEEISSAFSDALLLSTFGLKPDELGLMTYAQYRSLLDEVPNVITYQQTGKITENEHKFTAEENLQWMKEQGLLK